MTGLKEYDIYRLEDDYSSLTLGFDLGCNANCCRGCDTCCIMEALRLVPTIDPSDHPWSVRQAASDVYFSLTIMTMEMFGDCLNCFKRKALSLVDPSPVFEEAFAVCG